MENSFANKTPGIIAEELVEYSSQYQTLTEELYQILEKKAVRWNTLRDLRGSDKQADRDWEATKDGRREIELKLKLKALEKMISAIRTLLRTKSDEAHQLY